MNLRIPSAERATFALPLDREAFRVALRKGHGRARMHAKRYGVADRMEDVVHACLHNLAYDAQCEGHRGGWMLGLAEAAGARGEVIGRFLEAVHQPPEGEYPYWHIEQRCDLLKLLASAGDREARRRLYALLQPSSSSGDMHGLWQILELDGAEGLVAVCERVEQWLAEDPEGCDARWPVVVFDEERGEGAGAEVLEDVRRSNESIARYLDHLARREAEEDAAFGSEESDPNRPPPRDEYENVTAAQVIDWVERSDDDQRGMWLRMWAGKVDESELQVIVETLVEETHAPRMCKYLRAFQRRPVPVLRDEILALVDHPDRDVRWITRGVLGRVAHSSVRELALRRLQPASMLEGSLELFRSSYQPGDHVAIEEALFLPKDPDDLHVIVGDLRSVFEAHSLPEMRDLILFVYEHSPCGLCRQSALSGLENIDAVPDWVREEAELDSLREDGG